MLLILNNKTEAQLGVGNVTISPIIPSLVSSDHTAEGFLVTLSSGTLVHIFRLDPGFWGHHVGNSGRIVRRASLDNGQTWSSPIVIYDSPYDDRNVHGGIIGSDRIVMNFRRYNAITGMKIDFNTMYSDDGGVTWSPRTPLQTLAHASCNHTITYIPSKGYLNAIYGTNYIELRFSHNGINWDSISHVWDYTQDPSIAISEVCFTYLGNGKIIGLFRNDAMVYGSTFYQVVSSNYGLSWSSPALTQMADNFYTVSPLNFYDSFHQDLWTIATDRRGYSGPQFEHSQSRIYIYKNNPNEVIYNPLNYILYDTIGRPQPNIYRFYGYPITTRMANGNYLVIISESYRKANYLEEADFYQFEIQYPEQPEHLIGMNPGWSLFSTNINPNLSNIENIFLPYLEKTIIVKNDIGQVYWPNYRINQIVNLDYTKGYLTLTNLNGDLKIVGQDILVENSPVFLRQGWSFAGYPRKNPAPISQMLQSIETNLILVKDGLGQIYWPSFEINQIGEMLPGKGYITSMNLQTNLFYPSDSIYFTKSEFIIPLKPSYYNNTKHTDLNMVLGIPYEAWEKKPEIGTEIGVFDTKGQLISSACFDGKNIAIAIWGNDDFTQEKDGFDINESFQLKIKPGSERFDEGMIQILSFSMGTNQFKPNEICVVGKLKIVEKNKCDLKVTIWPNPATNYIEITYEGLFEARVKESIIDLNGNIVNSNYIEVFANIHSHQIDVSKLNAGEYALLSNFGEFQKVTKIIITK